MFVNIGKNRRNSDGGIIEKTPFYKALQSGTLNLPSREENVGGLNYVFVVDYAFAFGELILKPFPMYNQTLGQS